MDFFFAMLSFFFLFVSKFEFGLPLICFPQTLISSIKEEKVCLGSEKKKKKKKKVEFVKRKLERDRFLSHLWVSPRGPCHVAHVVSYSFVILVILLFLTQ